MKTNKQRITKFMTKRRKIILSISSFTIAVIIIIIGIVYATVTSQLRVTGTADIRNSKWKLKFDNLSAVSTTGSASEITAPTVIDDTHIGDYSVVLMAASDSISYTFDIVNEGDYDAQIGTTFALPQPVCHGAGEYAQDDLTNVCNNLEYTLKYASSSTNVAVGDVVGANKTVTMKLQLKLKDNMPVASLPKDDVEISNLQITIPFVQKDKAKVNTNGTTPYLREYSVGDSFTLNGEQYYIIANSSKNQDYVTALKANPLTVAELNKYGQSEGGSAHTHTDGVTGGIKFGSSSTYAGSVAQTVVNNWADDKFINELKQVNGYKARLIQYDELLDNLGYVRLNANTWLHVKTSDTPSWVYNSGYYYWTMTPRDDSDSWLWIVEAESSVNQHASGNSEPAIRPVINVYKSRI